MAGGLFAVALALGIFEIALSRGLYRAIPEGILLTSSYDQFTHLVWKLARFRSSFPKAKKPMIHFVGGSSLRECFPSAASLSKKMEFGFVEPLEIQLWPSAQQSFGESMAVVDQLPDASLAQEIWLVIGINPFRWARGPKKFQEQFEGQTLGLRSKTLDAFLEKEGLEKSEASSWLLPSLARWGSLWWNNHQYDLRHGKWPHHQYQEPFYTAFGALSYEKKRSVYYGRLKPALLENYPRFHAFNERALRALVARAKRKRFSVVLLEMPMHPLIERDLADFLAAYRRGMRQEAARLKIAYWEKASEIEWKDSDFYDLFHLVEPGRVKFETYVARELATHTRKGKPVWNYSSLP